MTEFRSAAEDFTTKFLDYVQTYDILDEFNKQTQKMQRSAGVEKLIKHAQSVFPPRVADGQKENEKLTEEQVQEAASRDNVVVLERREDFGRRIAANGGARGLLEKVLAGDPEAIAQAVDFVAAEKGEKEFYVPTKA